MNEIKRTNRKHGTQRGGEKGIIQRQQENLAVRGRIISSLLSTLDLERRLETILDEVTGFFSVEFGGIYLSGEGRVVLRSWKGLSPQLRSHLMSFSLSDIPEWIMKSRRCRKKLDEPGDIPEFAGKEGIQAFVSIPLKIPGSGEFEEGKWIGTIFLASKKYDAFKDNEMETLQRMADQLSFAIDHSRTYQSARQRLERLEVLRDIDRAIIRRSSLKEVLRVVLDRVPVELGADAVAISLINGEQERPELFAMRLPNGTVIEQEAFDMAESLLHWFVGRQETVIIYELAKDPRLQMHWNDIHGFRLSSYLGVPLIVNEKTIGILHILTKEPKVFEREAVSFFKTMAGQVAIAIENVRLFEATQRQARELEKKVAELEQMTGKLQESEARLSEAQRIAHLGSWEWEIPENRLSLSKELYHLFPVDAEIFEGTYEAAMEYIHPEDRDFVKKSFDETLYKNTPFDIEHRIILSDGGRKFVHQRAQLYVDEAGHPLRMIGTIQDITREKKLERIIIEQEKMASLGHMAAGIAHEIRNPLSGINVCLDAIRENLVDVDNTEDMVELIGEAKAATGKIEGVVKHVLDLAVPHKPSMKSISINEPIQEAIKVSVMSLRKFGIKLETDLATALPPVFADFQLLEQVLLNLLSNASEAMEEMEKEKKILVSSSAQGQSVVIKVSDSGPGIPLDARKQIFEPFYSTKPSGSGIGLSLCQRIIGAHAGTLEVSDSNFGGAEFTIRIPVDKRIAVR